MCARTSVCVHVHGLCVQCGGLRHWGPLCLFTLYTSDFTYSTDSCHLQKFSDDTAIVGCVSEGNDCEYRKVIMDFVDWCELNHLQVNASKTKEDGDRLQQETLIRDCMSSPSEHPGTSRTYKYLGVHLNNKLDWTDNTDSLDKKKPAQSVAAPWTPSRPLAKLSTTMDNTSHPLHQTLGALSSSFSNRLRHPRCRKERFRRNQY
ncbi:hypothetical protein L3Q82_003113 [Scortum barcoo]|uniref:Uncharacterized protein n=1 Tax=Scortum barcoo TaxID=214431 RepID=A0ACB8VRK5_9TELE|nr:hypothetical protein L3Q82_003113 [Scortum barcoo]